MKSLGHVFWDLVVSLPSQEYTLICFAGLCSHHQTPKCVKLELNNENIDGMDGDTKA